MRPGHLIIFGLVITLAACGEKVPLPTNVRDDDGGSLLDTTYAVVMPDWTEAGGIPFDQPRGVAIGYDRSIYICDTHNDRIVRLNTAGVLLESYSIPHPVAVAQDRSFNLVAVNDGPEIWSRRFRTSGDFVPVAHLDSSYRCILQRDGSQTCAWFVPRFESVAASPAPGGRFYAVAAAAVWGFFIEVPTLAQALDSGSAFGAVYNPTSVSTGTLNGETRIIVAQYPGYFGVQYLGGKPLGPILVDSTADVLLMTPDDTKYVAMDERGNVFVLLHEASFAMLFDKNGRYRLRFGAFGTGDQELRYPFAIAVLDETTYIADAFNNRIARYQITTSPEN